MKDKLEEYITQNKDSFEIENPPKEVWESLQNQIEPKSKQGFQFWKWAAAFLLLVSASLVYIVYEQNLIITNSANLYSLGDVSPEYAEIEKGYTQSIKEITTRINLEEIDRTDYAWLFEELRTLDELNENFRRDIYKVKDQERLVEILIDHYEKKLRILKKLEKEIQRNEQKKEYNDSTKV